MNTGIFKMFCKLKQSKCVFKGGKLHMKIDLHMHELFPLYTW